MFKFIFSGFKKDMLFFPKNVQFFFVFWKFVRCFKICSWFSKNVRVSNFQKSFGILNLFPFSKFVRDFQKMFAFQIFEKVLEFEICSHFSKFVRDFQKMFAFSNLFKFSKKFWNFTFVPIFQKLFAFFSFPVSFYYFLFSSLFCSKISNIVWNFKSVLFLKIRSDFSKNVQEFQKMFARSKFCSKFQKMIAFSKFCSLFNICSRFKNVLIFKTVENKTRHRYLLLWKMVVK